jgi:hypothetical protein
LRAVYTDELRSGRFIIWIRKNKKGSRLKVKIDTATGLGINLKTEWVQLRNLGLSAYKA